MIKWIKKRGFTDKLYVVNFAVVHIIVIAIVVLTALSGFLQISDMSALATIPPCAYAELGIHSAFIIWKAQRENMAKWNKKDEITL